MATGEGLIKDALQEINVLAVGETPDSDMYIHALGKLNRMVANWSNDGKKVYEITDETQAIVAATASYTIGDGATWDTNRPTIIESIHVRDANGQDFQVIEKTSKRWWDITDKSVTAGRPDYWYYDKSYPNGVLSFWPTPNANITCLLSSWKQFSAFTLTGTVALPIGYEEALILNLARRLCPSYTRKISNDLKAQAWEALDLIASANQKPGQTSVDSGLTRRNQVNNVHLYR